MLKLILRITLYVFFLVVHGYSAAAVETSDGLKKLFPDGLLNADGEVVKLDTLNGKVIGIYFSAHWCGPCRKFTPKLVEYRDANKDKFEVVFISSDRSTKAKREYMKKNKMKWPTVEWRSVSANALNKKFSVRGIPNLALLNDQGELLTKDGRSLIEGNINIDKLHGARTVKEEYKCGKCDKVHVRQKLVYPDQGR